MEHWLPFFVAVTALAVVLQTAILVGMYLQVRQLSERLTRMATDLEARAHPILSRLQVLLEDIQPRISSLVADTTEIVHLARGQAQKVDRVFSEAADRLRLQVIRVDQILTGALEAIEQAGAQIRRTIWSPLNQASAFIKGVKTGLYVLRSQNRPRNRSVEHQDEELFI